MEHKRGSFTGSIGFVLAAAGSAVGLGNLWRFPYLAAQYGGGIFVLVYIILALTFGFALMTTEIAIGRKTKCSPILAYGKLNKKFGFIGFFATLVPVVILPYYNVIGGWVLRYVVVYVQDLGGEAAQDGFFSEFIGATVSPIIFFAIFLLMTAGIVIAGVDKGIEKASKILMPILVILMIAICIFTLTIPNALEGIKHYLLPDFSKFSLKTICAAMGQMFFSMSLAMGIMITYGSYTDKEMSLGKSVNQIELFDTIIALLAGFMIIPTVFSYAGEAGLESSGPGLMFISLPNIFNQMAVGRIVGLAFFILVLFAAVTSSVSVMEAIVSSAMDRFQWSRVKSSVIVFIFTAIVGAAVSLGNGLWSGIQILGMDLLTFLDYLSNSLLMPFVALMTTILIGWVVGTKYVTDEVTRNGESFARKTIYEVMIKYIAPVLLVIILVAYTMAQFGMITL